MSPHTSGSKYGLLTLPMTHGIVLPLGATHAPSGAYVTGMSWSSPQVSLTGYPGKNLGMERPKPRTLPLISVSGPDSRMSSAGLLTIRSETGLYTGDRSG
eukprot:363456-Chlamydomonas_euryale.AAC.3